MLRSDILSWHHPSWINAEYANLSVAWKSFQSVWMEWVWASDTLCDPQIERAHLWYSSWNIQTADRHHRCRASSQPAPDVSLLLSAFFIFSLVPRRLEFPAQAGLRNIDKTKTGFHLKWARTHAQPTLFSISITVLFIIYQFEHKI